MDSQRDAVTPTPGDDRRQAHAAIARTRVELGETLNELHERLRPEHVKQQAKDAAREAVANAVEKAKQAASETAQMVAARTETAGRNTVDYFRTHPAQTAVIVGGLTWWLLNRSGSQTTWDSGDDSRERGYPPVPRSRPTSGMESSGTDVLGTAGEYVSSARETAGQYVDTAREKASEYVSAVGEVAGNVAESARTRAQQASEQLRGAKDETARRARETWGRTSRSVDAWIDDNPLAAGAVAVAVGAAVGLSAPKTAIENRTFGEARDQAMRAAGQQVSQLKDEVVAKAEKAIEAVTESTDAAPQRASM